MTAVNVAWQQITTRRIVDKALYGVRAACHPYIGKLNHTRLRGALNATLVGFLTRMVTESQLLLSLAMTLAVLEGTLLIEGLKPVAKVVDIAEYGDKQAHVGGLVTARTITPIKGSLIGLGGVSSLLMG